ncbi:MAG: phosphate ABC transporter permease PstA [Candidatus Eutrophobiaceae bacterium]
MTTRQWMRAGTPWIWLNAAAIAIAVCMALGTVVFIAWQGLACFWPDRLVQAVYWEPGDEVPLSLLGEVHDEKFLPSGSIGVAPWEVEPGSIQVRRYLLRVGNLEWQGHDFKWISKIGVKDWSYPEDAMVVERYRGGKVYGYIEGVLEGDAQSPKDVGLSSLYAMLESVGTMRQQIKDIENHDIAHANHDLRQLNLQKRRWKLDNAWTAVRMAEYEHAQQEIQQRYDTFQARILALEKEMPGTVLRLRSASAQALEVPLQDIVRIYVPNSMTLLDKGVLFMDKVWEFLSEDPREANVAGGIFPAIFGTVAMVLLMSVIVTPFGVIAAIYLREYATQNMLTRLVRISVNNLAGVPSIVFGVFGLGFFVYVLGGSIDALFYPEHGSAPVFGTGGLMWASLTLALLTVPVVIVATEEGLARIPSSLRESSLALGATRAETLWRVLIPMSSPAIMTGMILAVARAAGEVAPLMLVGVVKMASSLPIDDIPPFVHPERKFMHLGFHIYDLGFQSPNVEAVRPLVYATALVLILIIVSLNLLAIMIRNRLRDKYKNLE